MKRIFKAGLSVFLAAFAFVVCSGDPSASGGSGDETSHDLFFPQINRREKLS